MIIFGGTGFLGKHLCIKLHMHGHQGVTVVSRTPDVHFLKRFAHSIKSATLEHFLKSPHDVQEQCQTIVYLAGRSSPSTFADSPWEEFSANVAPALHLFKRCMDAYPTARLVFISSGGTVYGAGHREPIREDAPLRPISSYGLGKVAIEQALHFLSRTEGLQFDTLRVSNPVGRWQTNPTQGVINIMARAVIMGDPVKLFGSGSYVRDFLDADDVASAIMKIARRPVAGNCEWNIGSGRGTSIVAALSLIEHHFGTVAKKVFCPTRKLDVPYSVLDCTKAERELGWQATGGIEDILRKFDDQLR